MPVTETDFGLDKLLKGFQKPKSAAVHIGVFGDGAQREDDEGIDNVLLAAVHEFGRRDGSIPSRSFLRATIIENRRKYARMFEHFIKRFGGDPAGIRKTLDAMGLQVVGDVQKKISDGIKPRLEDSTLKAKKRRFGKESTTPLVATGDLRQSIASKVVNT